MSELFNLTASNKVPYTEIECKLSLEYSWYKNDKENIKKDKRAIKQFLQHCELEGIKSVKDTNAATLNTYLGAYIHPKISQLDEIVKILKYYELEANTLTVPLWLPPSLLRNILNLLTPQYFWKGINKILEQGFEHQYYLCVSECESCGKTVCVYRPKNSSSPQLLMFMSHLWPNRSFKMTDNEMVSIWLDTFMIGAIKNKLAFEHLYNVDIIDFGMFIEEMDKKSNK